MTSSTQPFGTLITATVDFDFSFSYSMEAFREPLASNPPSGQSARTFVVSGLYVWDSTKAYDGGDTGRGRRAQIWYDDEYEHVINPAANLDPDFGISSFSQRPLRYQTGPSAGTPVETGIMSTTIENLGEPHSFTDRVSTSKMVTRHGSFQITARVGDQIAISHGMGLGVRVTSAKESEPFVGVWSNPDVHGSAEVNYEFDDFSVTVTSADATFVAEEDEAAAWPCNFGKMRATGGVDGDRLGAAGALCGDYAVLTAPGEGNGVLYGFNASTAAQLWRVVLPLDSGAEEPSVARCGDRVAVGLPSRDEVWIVDPATGATEQVLTPDSNDGTSQFGTSVAGNANRLIVGAPGEDSGRGAAYVFDLPSGAMLKYWSPSFQPDIAAADAGFGHRVAISGWKVAVSCLNEQKVRVYSLRSFGLLPITLATLSPPSNWVDTTTFGHSLAMNLTQVVVGMPQSASGTYFPVVFTYHQQLSGSYTPTSSIGQRNSGFGLAVACEGNLALVGSPADDFGYIPDTGLVSALNLDHSNHESPIFTEISLPGLGETGDLIGGALDIEGGRALITSPGDGGGSACVHVVPGPYSDLPRLRFSDIRVSEGVGDAMPTASLLPAPSEDIGFTQVVRPGSAVAGNLFFNFGPYDYFPPATSAATWEAFSETMAIPIAIHDDAPSDEVSSGIVGPLVPLGEDAVEPDEDFFVDLTPTSSASFPPQRFVPLDAMTSRVVIVDNDAYAWWLEEQGFDDSGDSNGNGIDDPLDWALGTDLGGVPPALDGSYSFTFRDEGLHGAILIVEESENLEDWTEIARKEGDRAWEGSAEFDISGEGDFRTIAVPQPGGLERYFQRLRIEVAD